jgi:hypothetical protein
LFVVDEPNLNGIAPDLERVDAHDRPGEPIAHVGVHALDHGHHGDEEGDRHDDAQQGEERPELVLPNGLEGEQYGFGELHDLQT